MLFHSQGQVAHALLTRPPLSWKIVTRRIWSDNSVRLECVRHAASVHPEPGSNSRKYSIYSPFGLHINLSSFCSALLLFCKSFYFLFGIASSLHFSLQFLVYFVTLYFLSLSYISIWCVVQFSRIKGRSALLRCTWCSPAPTAALRAVQVSLRTPGSSFRTALSRTACTLYHLSSLLSRGFLNFFEFFWTFFKPSTFDKR